MTTNWLDLTDESAVEPELPIIDPHHHLWERQDDVYLELRVHTLEGAPARSEHRRMALLRSRP